MIRAAFFLPSLGGGGAERNILRLAGGFRRRGHQAVVVAARGSGFNRAWLPEGVELVDLGVGRVLAAVQPLSVFLRKHTPDVLVSALDEANLVALAARALSRTRVPVVVSSRSAITATEAHMRGVRARFVIPWLVRRGYPRADAIITVSDAAARDLARTLGLPPERVIAIPNLVVDDRLEHLQHDPPAHPWIAQIGDAPLVLAVGRLTLQKDYGLLVRAFARAHRQVPRARLAILGEGEDQPMIEALCRELHLGDVLLLAGFQENPYSWMRRADVLALSSRFEGLPTVVIEGLACGARVVATDCPTGPAEILDGGRWGRLVPVGDVDAFAAALVEAIGRGRWASPPVEALARYTGPPVVDAFEQLLHGVIASRATEGHQTPSV